MTSFGNLEKLKMAKENKKSKIRKTLKICMKNEKKRQKKKFITISLEICNISVILFVFIVHIVVFSCTYIVHINLLVFESFY